MLETNLYLFRISAQHSLLLMRHGFKRIECLFTVEASRGATEFPSTPLFRFVVHCESMVLDKLPRAWVPEYDEVSKNLRKAATLVFIVKSSRLRAEIRFSGK